jgi:carboxyl-terminal processing protease
VAKHPEAVNARDFKLTDAEYQEFIQWMSGKNYSYKSYLEYELQQFTAEAKKEKYFADLKGQIDQISNRIAESRKNELMLYKDEIKMLLEEDIVARQHLEKGSVEAGFKYDQDVKKAIEILRDDAQYKKILNIQ